MDDIQVRKEILKKLYKARKKGDGAYLDMWEIQKELGIDEAAIDHNVQYLVDKEFIEYAALGGAIDILIKGIDFVEGPSEFNPPDDYRQQVIQISGGTVGNVFQTQANHVSITPEKVIDRLMDQIENHPDIDPDMERKWKHRLNAMLRHPVFLQILGRVLNAT